MIEGQEGVTWPQWVALAHAAEEAQLDALFRSDHYRSIGRGDPNGALDAWGTICGLAAVTSTLRLGTLVTPVTFRKPSVLAKLVTTADHISNGRVELGLGAGWYESEHDAYGFDFMTSAGRLDELDRQLAEITRQWTEADDIWPKPVQQPRPPIIVGGRANRAPSPPPCATPTSTTPCGQPSPRRASASSASTKPPSAPAVSLSASR